MIGLNTLGQGELKLLRRLAIDPSLRKTGLARELGVTRSAVSQLWKKLEEERGLVVRGNLDYGRFGLQLVFGWACGVESSDILDKFSNWLKASSLVVRMTRSVMASTMDSRVYFEAVVPIGSSQEWLLNQLARFEKRPYSLSIRSEIASSVSHNMNLGIFDGSSWVFSNDFRLEASIGAAKGYVDVLPVVDTIEQSKPIEPVLEDTIIGSALNEKYYATASEVAERFRLAEIDPPAERTIRRKLVRLRSEAVLPYLDILNIGLNQKMMVCLRDTESGGSQLSRLLQAQATTFPKARVLSGSRMTVLDLEIPSQVGWLTMSQILSGLADKTSEICTFIADHHEIQKRLESVVKLYASHARSH